MLNPLAPLSPFYWIKKIISSIVIFLVVVNLILIPGWQKTSFEEMTDNFWGAIGNAFSESFDYYKSWFQSEETQGKIEETKGKIIDALKEKTKEEIDSEINSE